MLSTLSLKTLSRKLTWQIMTSWFSMARGRNVLSILSQAEQSGLPVINAATRLLQLSRGSLIQLLQQHDLPLPHIQLCELTSSQIITPRIAYPFWVKRVDACAQQKGDVSFVNGEAEYQTVIKRFRESNITSYVIEQHIEGDLVKFYGVEGTAFFHVSYPTESANGFSKFGLDRRMVSHLTSTLMSLPLSRRPMKQPNLQA